MKYVNEIEELNLQLNELNDAFTVEKQEKLKYVNEIKILNRISSSYMAQCFKFK